MPTRGDRLQEIFDLGHRAVTEQSDVRSLRDLHGPAGDGPDCVDPIRTVLGAMWEANQDLIRPILEILRCGGCPMCNGETPDGMPRALCAFASFDAVEAFKDGARQAVWTKVLARLPRGATVYGGA